MPFTFLYYRLSPYIVKLTNSNPPTWCLSFGVCVSAALLLTTFMLWVLTAAVWIIARSSFALMLASSGRNQHWRAPSISTPLVVEVQRPITWEASRVSDGPRPITTIRCEFKSDHKTSQLSVGKTLSHFRSRKVLSFHCNIWHHEHDILCLSTYARALPWKPLSLLGLLAKIMCSICSFQLNIWNATHRVACILNWFLNLGHGIGACSVLATGWPGIALPPGSAHPKRGYNQMKS